MAAIRASKFPAGAIISISFLEIGILLYLHYSLAEFARKTAQRY
jgi:hypothetical protein